MQVFHYFFVSIFLSYSTIDIVCPRTNDVKSNKNAIMVKKADFPGKRDSNTFKLYDETAKLFHLIESNKNTKYGIGTIYPIDDNTEQVVNDAMSILLDLQRNDKIQIDDLTRVYYILFDIKHMYQSSDYFGVLDNKIVNLLLNVEYIKTDDTKQLDISNKKKIVSNIKQLLDNFKNSKINASDIMVNVDLMKSMMFIYKTDNEHLNTLKKGMTAAYKKEIEWQQYEIEGPVLDKNHVKLLCTIMPDLFGLLHNHVQLLVFISDHTMYRQDMMLIIGANKFFVKFLKIFINRYLNFGKKNKNPSQNLSIVDQFLQIVDNDNMYQKYFEKTESDKNSVISQNVDLKKLLTLEELAIKEVLSLTGKSDLNIWKVDSVFRVDYKENKGKRYYRNLIRSNIKVAYSLLGAIDTGFLKEIEDSSKPPNTFLSFFCS